MQKIKLGIMTLALSLVALSGFTILTATHASALPSAVSIVASTPQQDACAGLGQLAGGSCGDSSGVNKLITAVVSILSIIVGIAAVIMVIISGLKYVTASGDPSNISSAKNTLLYALVGLFIAALAQFLVHFVLRSVPK